MSRTPPALVLLLPASLALSGCSSAQVGGKPFPVMLHTVPEVNATAYVVPLDEWKHEVSAKGGEEAALADSAFLRPYQVKSDHTPIKVWYASHSYVFIADSAGKRSVSNPFTPGEASAADVSVMVK